MAEQYPEMPIIHVGRHRGTPIDQLPTAYLRWMLGQDFPQEWLEIAKRKVESSPFYNEQMTLSRHAIDRFSTRFLGLWSQPFQKGLTKDGMATFLVKLADMAWKHGQDISKNRHNEDGIVKLWKGMKFVFNQNPKFPEYRDLITIM